MPDLLERVTGFLAVTLDVFTQVPYGMFREQRRITQ